MPLKLKIKRRLLARSDRVKSVELHQSEPWMLVSLYSGRVFIWNFESKQIVKTIDVCDAPVRVVKFVSRKNWLIAGSDDTFIRVFNYNTLERVAEFAAHMDYIRTIAVHPTSSIILTAGDDGVIKLWDWGKMWACSQVFRGHTYVIMQVVFNPKDNNQFASASLDRSVKVWQLGSPVPNFSLKHEKDVNCLDYHPGGDKPYIVSGEDDGTVRVWDYQTKSCVQSLQIHSKDVYAVVFHPSLPIILSGSADGSVRIIHSNTYRLENSLSYGLERVWSIGCHRGTNNVAIGFDEGSLIIRLGQEEPAISMDSSGKIIWAKHSEIQQANIKAMADQEIKDGERLSLAVKDMGSCEIYPQTISHSRNGRFVALCGDGEYIIYTAMALRNKSYGTAQEFVWSQDSSVYAVRADTTSVRVFKNFKEHKLFKPSFGTEGIYGGHLLGVRSLNSLAFYDWETTKLIRRIEISPKNVTWSENGSLVALATEDSLYVLRYKAELVEQAKEVTEEDGIEEAFEVEKEMTETVRTGLWAGDCFVYTSGVNRLNYYVGGEIVTIAHLDREMYLLGYIPKENRLYLGDKELSIVSYSLLLSVLEYQTAVMRRDFDTADTILPRVPREQRTRVAMFLEKQGFRTQALAVSSDSEHKFDLAIQLGDLKTAYSLAKQNESAEKWKQLAEQAIKHSEFGLAQECLHSSQDFGGLLLLASSAGHRSVMAKLAQEAVNAGQNNVAFLANFISGRSEECLEILINTKRLPEAAFFARSYLPSQTSRVVDLWKKHTAALDMKSSNALADPAVYQNLFTGFGDSLKAEQFLKQQGQAFSPAAFYSTVPTTVERNAVEEMHQAEKSGKFVYSLRSTDDSVNEIDNDGSLKEKEENAESSGAMSTLTDLTNGSTLFSPLSTMQSDIPSFTEFESIKKNFPENFQKDHGGAVSSAKSLQDNKDAEDLEKDLDLVLDNMSIDDFDIVDIDLLNIDEFLED